jgi:hypothetical protein
MAGLFLCGARQYFSVFLHREYASSPALFQGTVNDMDEKH